MNFILILCMTLAAIGLLKAQKRLMPKSYFYFGKLIEGYDEDVPFFGVVFRTFIPLFMGFLTGAISVLMRYDSPPHAHGLAVGFLAAFLIVWPDIYNPELVSAQYARMRGKLAVLHLMLGR